MGKKIDRRVRKTKQQLQDGFIYLRKQKDLKEITVKELCELTDLNRGTFYLHYKDILKLFIYFVKKGCYIYPVTAPL